MSTQGDLQMTTQLHCRQCAAGPLTQPRNGQRRDFCSTGCRTLWHLGQRARAAKLLAKAPALTATLGQATNALDAGELDTASGLVQQVILELQGATSQ